MRVRHPVGVGVHMLMLMPMLVVVVVVELAARRVEQPLPPLLDTLARLRAHKQPIDSRMDGIEVGEERLENPLKSHTRSPWASLRAARSSRVRSPGR